MVKSKYKNLSEYRPGDLIRGVLKACPSCEVWFIGRDNQEYCSDKCRHRARRRREREIEAARLGGNGGSEE